MVYDGLVTTEKTSNPHPEFEQSTIGDTGLGELQTPKGAEALRDMQHEGLSKVGLPCGLPSRYDVLERIAEGASGEVVRAWDRRLDRAVAMKVMHFRLVTRPSVVARFWAEATVTAALQHPGIVSVHDRGTLPDGRPWFTMTEVRGSTFSRAIERLHAEVDDKRGVDRIELRRVVEAFARVCDAVGYAHRLGIIHRDLKPANLMLGEFGEVMVMDWGLARGQRTDEERELVRPATASDLTRDGDVMGTPCYMAPEQARGDAEQMGPTSDVYSLGGVLHTILSGTPPLFGPATEVLTRLVAGSLPALASSYSSAVPADLIEIVDRAMAEEPERRYSDAEALGRATRSWLDGALRRDRATAFVARADEVLVEVVRLRGRAQELRADAMVLRRQLSPWAPLQEKRRLWHIEDEVRRVGNQLAIQEADWLHHLRTALSLDPEIPAAHHRLGDHYRAELSTAEAAADSRAAASALAHLRAHDLGKHAGVIAGLSWLSLHSSPGGAEVELFRFEEADRRLRPVSMGVVGHTPIERHALAFGSYLAVLRSPGCADLRVPIQLVRGEHWDNRAPFHPYRRVLHLLREDALGPDEVYVPAGWAWLGADDGVPDAVPVARVWIDDFIIRRFPVLDSEYVQWLNALHAHSPQRAIAYAPRLPAGQDTSESRFAYDYDSRRGFRAPDPDDRPVVQVDWRSAAAFAAAEAQRTGKAWRLPDAAEREKAARGVDGRKYPWGQHFDPTWTAMSQSKPDHPERVSVGAYPEDISVYGVRHMAGNTRDWCENRWEHEGPKVENERHVREPAPVGGSDYMEVRGGAWFTSPELCHAAARFGNAPDVRRSTIGIRLVRGVDECDHHRRRSD